MDGRRTSTSERDSPRVLLPPPLVYVAAFVLATAVDRVAPWRIPQSLAATGVVTALGVALLAAGLILDFWALGLFGRFRTSALPFRPATSLVAKGPYRFTRNPMYLGLTSTLTGIGLLLDRLWVVPGAFAAAIVIDRVVIRREEAYLERAFGDTYLDFRRRVRRWI